MLGIALARHAAELPLPWAAPAALFGLALAFAALFALPPDKALALACPPLLCCAGFLHGHAALERFDSPDRVGALVAASGDAAAGIRVTLAGRILDMVEYDGGVSRCALAVEWALLLPDGATGAPPNTAPQIHKKSGKAALRVRGRLPETVRPGARVLALGRLERARDPASGHDVALWLKSPEALRPQPAATSPAPSLGERVRFGPERLRGRIARFLAAHLPPEVAGVYQALLIGSRQGLAPDLLERFKVCGCMHILAISGRHVGLVAAMTGALFHRLLSRSTRILLSGHAKV